MTRDTQSAVRNPATAVVCHGVTAGCVSDTRGETTVPKTKRSTRHTASNTPSTADVPAVHNTSADVPADNTADTLIGTIPDTSADVPADVPAVPTWIETFHVTFPAATTVPTWIDPMCGTINAVWNGVPADVDRNALTFDAWIDRLNAADPSERPARGHRYTMGSGSDIARTQNTIYVALMLCGIPWKRVPVNFGAALWRFVLGATKCDYREHADYFVSTFGRFVAHDHNDTTGINNADAENACRVWRDAKPEPDPEPAE